MKYLPLTAVILTLLPLYTESSEETTDESLNEALLKAPVVLDDNDFRHIFTRQNQYKVIYTENLSHLFDFGVDERVPPDVPPDPPPHLVSPHIANSLADSVGVTFSSITPWRYSNIEGEHESDSRATSISLLTQDVDTDGRVPPDPPPDK